MFMAAKMAAPPNYPTTAVFTSPRCRRSRVVVLACLHNTSLACSWITYPQCCLFPLAGPSASIKSPKKISWSVRSRVDGGGEQDSLESSTNGETRLVRAIQAFRIKLSSRIKEIKKQFPMKVLFFLMGFYCATAFATVIGQTGDWDILSAGLAVFIVEGIGALMYKSSFPLLDKFKSLITMFNYWKAGLSMGLFLDAFKYEIDDIFGSNDLFNFEIDIFLPFL